MKNRSGGRYLPYLTAVLRFKIHLYVFIVTLSCLWVFEYLQRKTWGAAWLITISLAWSLLLLVHFLIMLWKRGGPGKLKP